LGEPWALELFAWGQGKAKVPAPTKNIRRLSDPNPAEFFRFI
jgi:hypothetical protein